MSATNADDVSFDRGAAEKEIRDALARLVSGTCPRFLASAKRGVIAFERLPDTVTRKVDWHGLASDLGAKAGHPVVCIADFDWHQTQQRDRAATLVAFDVPGLDEDFRDDYRNKLPNALPCRK